jgi:tetratricopeptide (TPR) repeat protein
MRAYVLPDPRLAKLAGRFVWLEVDTEKPRNRAFVERFPIDAWPCLLVVHPGTEEVLVRWAGTATVEEVERLAADGERAFRARAGGAAEAALARADRLLGERRHAEAAEAYREALSRGGRRAPFRDRAAESVVQALGLAGDHAGCAAAARAAPEDLAPASAARTAAQGLSCALELDGAGRREAIAALEPRARRALAARAVLAEDRTWLLESLADAREAVGDPAGATALLRRALALLEEEARRAPTPAARSAFDGQRLRLALRLGEPGRVLAALVASERDLPGEYVPATNLGVLYLALGRPADALAAADRALARAEGPRRVRVLVLRAEAQTKLGETQGARESLSRALAEAEALPENARPESQVRRARALIEALPGS